MQSTKKRNLILTLLVGLLMSVLAFVGISLAPKTAFADANFDGSELLGDKVQVGDSLVGKTIKVEASSNGDGTVVTIKTQNYIFEFAGLDPFFYYQKDEGMDTNQYLQSTYVSEFDENGIQLQYYTFGTSGPNLTNETVAEIIGDDVYYVETDDSTTTDPEDPGTTPEDPEDPGTTPEDPETPGDDVTLLPDVSEETTKWGEITETVANWFSENTGLKITGSFVSIALFGLVLILIFKKK